MGTATGDHTPRPAKGEGSHTGGKGEKQNKKNKGKGEERVFYDRESYYSLSLSITASN